MALQQGRLVKSQRFMPFFLTQALGAFNDNVFKQAIVLAILFKLPLSQTGLGRALGADVLVNLCALLFILPFFLFSALGGQLGEKCAKDRLIRGLKSAEVLLALVAGIAIYLESLPLMLALLFAMGVQSALFGPVKYAILPEHLAPNELLAGNALVEMGTFVAILMGTVLAGVLLAQTDYAVWVAGVVLVAALAGWLASRYIPAAPAKMAALPIDLNLWRQSKSILKLGLSQATTVRYALFANAWFWFLGATYLTQIPNYAKQWLQGDETLVTVILTLFSIGIAAGSLLCEKLSRAQIEPAVVPLGALGLSVFGLLLYWHSNGIEQHAVGNWVEMISQGPGLWVLLDFFALGLFGGIYIVPLYALIQARTLVEQRSRVIAANNILNALFMVLAALFAMLLLGVVGLNIAQLFALVAVLGLVVNGWLFYRAPEFVRRLHTWRTGGKAPE